MFIKHISKSKRDLRKLFEEERKDFFLTQWYR